MQASLNKIPQELRYRILITVLNKGVKPRDLEITPAYKYMLLKKKKPISDSLLEKLLKYLSPQELIQLGIVLSGKNLNPTLSNSSTVWAGSSAWQSARLASERSRVQIPAGPPTPSFKLPFQLKILPHYLL